MLTRVLNNLEAEFLVRPHFSYRCMIDLEGLDLLAKIGGMPADVNHIAVARPDDEQIGGFRAPPVT